MTNQDVTDLFNQWNEAISSNNSKNVTALYAEDAILLPTISNLVRHNHAEIEDYFDLFLASKPRGELLEQNIRIFDELVMNSGIYAITFEDGTTVNARFSFVYQYIAGAWKIIEHHSSRMPAA